jgi:diguanylate cyclase (GGDEF)-like protein
MAWVAVVILVALGQSRAAVSEQPPRIARGSRRFLTQIAQVRRLGPEEAARRVPVELTGVVTAMPGFKNSFFLQDQGMGISVDRTDDAEVHPGDRVHVKGTSGPGLFAPVVLAYAVRVIGRAPPPRAPRKTLGDLFGGVEDSQWIELRGVVRSAKWTDLFGHQTLLLGLQQDGGSVGLLIQESMAIDPAQLIDAVIRVRGVCASSGNEKRQFVGSALLVPHRGDLTVEVPAPLDPFSAPARRVRDVLLLGQWQHRVRVTGVVTHQIPGEAVYLQDGSDGIRVETESKVTLPLGSSIEAVGFPNIGDYSPILEAGLVRRAGAGVAVRAVAIQAGEVIPHGGLTQHSHYDQQLVQLEGKLVEEYREADQRVWILTQGNEMFEARVPVSSSSGRFREMSLGSVLSLTGICSIHMDSRMHPISFAILVQSGQDVVIVKHAPWWTPGRTLLLLAVLAGVTVLVVLWVVVLRSRVERQTRTIRESERRFRYLAEHDGLTGLLNRVAILAALDHALERASREKSTVIVVLADVDHFKLVNDVHGHLAGDAALRRFAELLTGGIRSYDSAGRYGGEEFLLVLPGIAAEDAANRMISLHAAISNTMVSDGKNQFGISCSLGAIFVDKSQGEMQVSREETEQHAILAAADHALYEAKETGRNRVVYRRLESAHVHSV